VGEVWNLGDGVTVPKFWKFVKWGGGTSGCSLNGSQINSWGGCAPGERFQKEKKGMLRALGSTGWDRPVERKDLTCQRIGKSEVGD